jgi:hypothetical protein
MTYGWEEESNSYLGLYLWTAKVEYRWQANNLTAKKAWNPDFLGKRVGEDGGDLRTIGITPRPSSYHFLSNNKLPLAVRIPPKRQSRKDVHILHGNSRTDGKGFILSWDPSAEKV